MKGALVWGPRNSPGAETTEAAAAPLGTARAALKRTASEPGWHPALCLGCTIWVPGLKKTSAYSPDTPERASSAWNG